MLGGIYFALPGCVFRFARFNGEVEIKRDITFKTGNQMAHLTGNRFIRTGIFFWPWRRNITGKISHRRMTAIAAGMGILKCRIVFTMSDRQLKILNLIPFVGVGLLDHGLLLLPVEIGMAGSTAISGFFEFCVRVCSHSGINIGK